MGIHPTIHEFRNHPNLCDSTMAIPIVARLQNTGDTITFTAFLSWSLFLNSHDHLFHLPHLRKLQSRPSSASSPFIVTSNNLYCCSLLNSLIKNVKTPSR